MTTGSRMTRRIPLAAGSELPESRLDALRQTPQLHQVSVHRDTLKVTYDARYFDFEQLQLLLQQHQLVPRQSFWLKRRYRHYRNSDYQARENSQIVPFCCSKVPIRKENL